MIKYLLFILLIDLGLTQVCKKLHECPQVFNVFKVKNSSPIICDEEEETVMCPAVQESIEQKKCIQYLKSILVYDEDEEEYVDKCSTLAVPFIIGGQETIPHEFPHQALLGNTNDEWYCGGSLISEKFVLTAAHCLKPKPVIVKLGMHSLRKDDEKVQKFGVKRVFLHPSYQKPAVYHDIGLIELKRRVKFTPYIRPICLPTTSDINFVEKLTATGFGLTKYEGEQSETLQKIELPKVSEESCNEKFINQNKSLPQGILADGQLCYGGELGRDACSGDSGGPLQRLHKNVYCSYIQFGITSVGAKCGQDYPGIYTSVLPYMDWIKGQIW